MIRDLHIGPQILDLDIVASLLVIPVSTSNLMLSLDEASQSVLVRKPVKIVEYFLASSIYA